MTTPNGTAGARRRQRLLAMLLPVLDRRVLEARIALMQCHEAIRRAESHLKACQDREAGIAVARTRTRTNLATVIQRGSTAAVIQQIVERIGWLDQDHQSAHAGTCQARQDLADAQAQRDDSVRRLLRLNERSRQLGELARQSRRTAERHIARRMEIRFAEQAAARRR